MLTEKDYCDKDLTAALKDLGFPTKMVFMGEQATIEIPINSGLIQLYEAQKFLREAKKIEIVVLGQNNIDGPYYPDIFTEDGLINNAKGYKTYEEALSEGIKEAVKILKRE